ncbi:hypothetical protein IF1G_04376 [Cordyceps javanica]|uniref:Uncharacterized protein n=1 Tax=Cordyceps javanica TaxID=43265 RepID=A0A545V600_9HYPO|nr:hypothetical protein IF1G_04376 [Cordyceps javanica]
MSPIKMRIGNFVPPLPCGGGVASYLEPIMSRLTAYCTTRMERGRVLCFYFILFSIILFLVLDKGRKEPIISRTDTTGHDRNLTHSLADFACVRACVRRAAAAKPQRPVRESWMPSMLYARCADVSTE